MNSNREDDRATRPPRAADWAKSLPLYPLPHHLISRIVNHATRWRARWWKNALIRWFVGAYGVDMSQALEEDPTAYQHFNAFFTRPLKADSRPLPDSDDAVCCPADGAISEFGRIDGERIFQAKGKHYSLMELLGGSAERAESFRGGEFLTVYLSPSDYHRVHMPRGGTLREMVHVPGRLFSVAPHTVKTIPNLFARNERVVTIFDTADGPMALVLVGAINVASIETVWSGVVTPPMGRQIREWSYADSEAPRLQRGEEMGRFNMGSTVIVLFGKDRVRWLESLKLEQKVRVREALGRVDAG